MGGKGVRVQDSRPRGHEGLGRDGEAVFELEADEERSGPGGESEGHPHGRGDPAVVHGIFGEKSRAQKEGEAADPAEEFDAGEFFPVDGRPFQNRRGRGRLGLDVAHVNGRGRRERGAGAGRRGFRFRGTAHRQSGGRGTGDRRPVGIDRGRRGKIHRPLNRPGVDRRPGGFPDRGRSGLPESGGAGAQGAPKAVQPVLHPTGRSKGLDGKNEGDHGQNQNAQGGQQKEFTDHLEPPVTIEGIGRGRRASAGNLPVLRNAAV